MKRFKGEGRTLNNVTVIFSCTDKSKLEAWAPVWRRGAEFVSVGGTLKKLRELGMSVTPIERFTGGQGECLDGLVKTLHQSVFKASLADPKNAAHVAVLADARVAPIDIVVMNQYDWNAGVAAGKTGAELIKHHFDVGGNCVPLAALKGGRIVVMDPADYEQVVHELTVTGGVSTTTRDILFNKALAKIIEALAKIRDWSTVQLDQAKPLFA